MLASQRALFDIPPHICYLNAASYSPLPLRTLDAGRAAVGRKGKPWTLAAGFAGEQHERARLAAARLINADAAEHRRRVESRASDIDGLVLPTWQDVLNRTYEPWDREHVVLDTATGSVDQLVERIAAAVGPGTMRT